MIKAVLFDIDRTLLDHDGASARAINICYHRWDWAQSISFQDFVSIWNAAQDKYMQEYLVGKLSFEGQRIARMKAVCKKIGRPCSEDDAQRLFYEFLAQYENNWELFDDVISCLDALSDYKLGIVSNGDSEQQREKLSKTGIREYFSSIMISGDIGISKPDVRIFKSILDDMGASPVETVMVGDDLEHDVLPAQQAGILGVLIDRASVQAPPEEKKYKVIYSLENLGNALMRTKTI